MNQQQLYRQDAKFSKNGKRRIKTLILFFEKFVGLLGALGVLAVIWIWPAGVQAAFLDFSMPARDAAMGSNGVATAAGTANLIFNPAGLGDGSRFEVSARYENLFSGIEGNGLSTGNLSAVLPFWDGNVFGLSVDSFGSTNIQQDRLIAAFGKRFEKSSFLSGLRLGADISYLRQQFTLSTPLAGVNAAALSAGAFALGAGALYNLFPNLTIGFSAEDLNQPNLGVVGVDRFPVLCRYGAALKLPVEANRLLLTLAQSFGNGVLETQGGAEWNFTQLGIFLRAGMDPNTGMVGMGWHTNGLSFDYAYQFTVGTASSLNGMGFPGSHLLEVGYSWENTPKDQKVYEGLVGKGSQASLAQQWKEAFWYYQQALSLNPTAPPALEGRANALRRYNQQRAADYFESGQQAEKRGYFLEAQKNYEWASYLAPGEPSYSDALQKVKKALTEGALSDPRVQKILERAVALLKSGQNTAALKEIKAAQELYPNDAFVEFLLNAFNRKALARMKPEDKKVGRWMVEAEIYRSKGRMDLARETWKKILVVDPDNAQAKENFEKGEASASVKEISAAEKARVQTLQEQGMKAYLNEDVEGAIRDWEEALKIDPNNVNILNNLTRVKMEEGSGKK